MAIVVQNTAKSAVGAARDAFEAIVNAHRHLGGSRLGVQLEPNGSAIKGIGFLDDYAFMARAALDLARFERDPVQQARYIGLAASWMDYVIRHFGDGEGGFYTTGDDHEALIHRPQTTYDQATPCGSAVVIENLISLAELDAVENSEKWAKAADEGLKYLNGVLGRGVLGQGAIVSARLLAAKGAVVIKTGVGARLRSSPNIGAEGPPWRTWRMFDVPGIPADETWVCTQRTCKVLR